SLLQRPTNHPDEVSANPRLTTKAAPSRQAPFSGGPDCRTPLDLLFSSGSLRGSQKGTAERQPVKQEAIPLCLQLAKPGLTSLAPRKLLNEPTAMSLWEEHRWLPSKLKRGARSEGFN